MTQPSYVTVSGQPFDMDEAKRKAAGAPKRAPAKVHARTGQDHEDFMSLGFVVEGLTPAMRRRRPRCSSKGDRRVRHGLRGSEGRTPASAKEAAPVRRGTVVAHRQAGEGRLAPVRDPLQRRAVPRARHQAGLARSVGR